MAKANITVVKDATRRNRRFEKICSMSQMELKDYLKEELIRTGRTVESGDGYLYCEGTIPVILCAHMDTVHEERIREIVYKDGTVSSPQGIGGDDRCGVYMILKILEEIPCHVLFLEDEEVGGEGAEKFTWSDLSWKLHGKIEFCIELDRRGSNDAVYYNLDNPDFEGFVEKEFWKFATGTYTDICTICPSLSCAGVNLSCGYYNEHRPYEHVVLDEMYTAIDEVKKLLWRHDGTFYEYRRYETPWDSWRKDLADDQWGDYTQTQVSALGYYEIQYIQNGSYMTERVDAISVEEAVGIFLMDHPTMCFNDILDVC